MWYNKQAESKSLLRLKITEQTVSGVTNWSDPLAGGPPRPFVFKTYVIISVV